MINIPPPAKLNNRNGNQLNKLIQNEGGGGAEC